MSLKLMENCDFTSRIIEEPSNDESCKSKNKKTKTNRERSNKPSKKLKKKISNKAELPLAFKEKIEQMEKWKMETAEVYNITDGWNKLVADNNWKKRPKGVGATLIFQTQPQALFCTRQAFKRRVVKFFYGERLYISLKKIFFMECF
ncbi:unnamed protein product [Vicia faba]|uniref:Uncharacterized protein n=1 Tax=Vicia faba TaxID=3906 RepID=A0AAV0YNY3_VICFA|nr:unnamed protein product [Vicia faba]